MNRIDVPTGHEVGAYLEGFIEEQRISEAAVQVFGALENGIISAMTYTGMDVPQRFVHPMEVHGIGDVRGGRLHLHLTIGSNEEPARCGHFIEGIAGELFAAHVWPL